MSSSYRHRHRHRHRHDHRMITNDWGHKDDLGKIIFMAPVFTTSADPDVTTNFYSSCHHYIISSVITSISTAMKVWLSNVYRMHIYNLD